MQAANCPVLAQIQPRAGVVILVIQSGRHFASVKADRVLFAPDRALLMVQGQAFSVPAELYETVRRSFSLEPVATK